MEKKKIKKEMMYIVLLFVQERLSLKLHHNVNEKSLIKQRLRDRFMVSHVLI